jgi:hypothetical protein
VRVPAGGLVNHQQMLILKNHARRHAQMKPFFNTLMKAWNQEAAAGDLAPEARQTIAHGETVGKTRDGFKPRTGRKKLLFPLGRGFPGFGDDFFEVNFQNRSDAEQGVQGRVLHFLFHVADRLPRQACFLRQHVQRKAAFFARFF